MSGLQRYAALMAHLSANPSTALEIVGVCGLCPSNSRRVMRELHALGLIHVSGWKRPHVHCAWCRVYSAGSRPDVAPPALKTGEDASLYKAQSNGVIRRQVQLFARFWNGLRMEISAIKLSERSDLSLGATRRLLEQCRALGLVRIGRWRWQSQRPVARYVLGSYPDAKRPPATPKSVLSARARAKRKHEDALDVFEHPPTDVIVENARRNRSAIDMAWFGAAA
jgi:hypothetical protein